MFIRVHIRQIRSLEAEKSRHQLLLEESNARLQRSLMLQQKLEGLNKQRLDISNQQSTVCMQLLLCVCELTKRI